MRTDGGEKNWQVDLVGKRMINANDILIDQIVEVISRTFIANDISARKRVEEALRMSEERYQDLFENANDAIFIVDAELYCVDVNKKAVELLGYSKEDLLAVKITDVIPSQQLSRPQMEFEKLGSRGSY